MCIVKKTLIIFLCKKILILVYIIKNDIEAGYKYLRQHGINDVELLPPSQTDKAIADSRYFLCTGADEISKNFLKNRVSIFFNQICCIVELCFLRVKAVIIASSSETHEDITVKAISHGRLK